MAKVQLGSNTQFLGPGLGLSVINDRCFAYSGRSDFANTETTILEFASPPQTIVAKLSPYYSATSGDVSSQDAFFRVYLNDVLVNTIPLSHTDIPADVDYNFIIPPLSLVKVTGKNTSGGTVISFFATLIGRLYA